MKKLSLIFFFVFFALSTTSYVHALGLDDAKKTKKIAEITPVIAKDGTSDKFLSCVSTKDPSVYAIITDKDKMSNLKDMPLKDVEKINTVVKSCKVS